MRGSILLLLLFPLCALSQISSTYLKIETDAITGEVLNLKLYEDSLKKWIFYPTARDTLNTHWKFIYDISNTHTTSIRYLNGVTVSIDSVKIDSNGRIIPQTFISEIDCTRGGVVCVYDKNKRLIDAKKYSPKKGIFNKRELIIHRKYFYIQYIDAKIMSR
jgi:hypothetical protein